MVWVMGFASSFEDRAAMMKASCRAFLRKSRTGGRSGNVQGNLWSARARTRGRARRAFAQDDHAEHLVLRDVGHVRGADELAVLHHADPVGQTEHVVDV